MIDNDSFTSKPNAMTIDTAPAPASALCAFFLLASMLCFASGCAHQMSEPYEPGLDELNADQPLDISLNLHSERGDEPNSPIGSISNMPGGGVVLVPPHDDWLLTGLTREFERAGIWVHDEQSPDRPHVEVRHVEFAGEVVNRTSLGEKGAAIAAFDVQVTIPGPDIVFRRQFAASTNDESRRSVDSEDLEALMRSALGDVYAEIVTETHRLLLYGPRG